MEGSLQLDISSFMGDTPPNQLIPVKNKLLVLQRNPDRYILFLLSLVFVIKSILYFLTGKSLIYPIIITILIVYYLVLKNKSNGMYIISGNTLNIPYLWFYRKKLQMEEIIEIKEEKLIDKINQQQYFGYRLILDTKLSKYNTTGLEAPSIILSSRDYDKQDLKLFIKELNETREKQMIVPHTLAQRLTDQVKNSWNARWTNLWINNIEIYLDIFIISLLLDLILSLFFPRRPYILLLIILVAIILLLVTVYQISEMPNAIIGMRPHELGAVIYNEADLLTTIKFIVMSLPDDIILTNCQLIYDKQPLSNIDTLKELHPKEIKAGQLTYGVAQFIGNHTKAVGAKIQFTYKNETEIYSIPIYWA